MRLQPDRLPSLLKARAGGTLYPYTLYNVQNSNVQRLNLQAIHVQGPNAWLYHRQSIWQSVFEGPASGPSQCALAGPGIWAFLLRLWRV